MDDAVFLVPGQRTTTAGLLGEAAGRRGMEVRGLDAELGGLAGRVVYWCGGPAAGARVAGALGIGLLEPPDDWLAGLPEWATGRGIRLSSLGEARAALRGPAFVKPPREKSFPAAVYADGAELPELPPDTPVLVSGVVDFAAEYRLFLLDGEIAAGSRYAVHGRLDPAPLDEDPRAAEVRAFAARLLAAADDTLPSAVTVDVGFAGGTVVVVEANMAWFSNCYAADPGRVLDVVLRSAGPRERVSEADRRFVRG
ncbi:ATP-grasp domain-containing protein [Streptomyces sp. NBC_00335]|uniref:ATP-grasp domain-containing protein n=1 Tax=unclassified Streptomyces TaxID=2593676 RepID=UPI0022573563|nr:MULTISPECIES: ATP-grasp domain-containing protein [unclassified Streptomyces]MCX5406136.1 ATP-grasp domain-containing protein [Streptomyces sp. NBC_00086]